jgi:hypothetical protein
MATGERIEGRLPDAARYGEVREELQLSVADLGATVGDIWRNLSDDKPVQILGMCRARSTSLSSSKESRLRLLGRLGDWTYSGGVSVPPGPTTGDVEADAVLDMLSGGLMRRCSSGKALTPAR